MPKGRKKVASHGFFMYFDYFFSLPGLHLASLGARGNPGRHKPIFIMTSSWILLPKDAQRDAHGAHTAALVPQRGHKKCSNEHKKASETHPETTYNHLLRTCKFERPYMVCSSNFHLSGGPEARGKHTAMQHRPAIIQIRSVRGSKFNQIQPREGAGAPVGQAGAASGGLRSPPPWRDFWL